MSEFHLRFSTADWIVAGTALFIIGNGVSVCVGWWMHVPILVQLSPDVPTHFNTALIFIVLGVGELGLVLRRRGVVLAAAVVVTCVAGAEFAEYALRLNMGVDTLLAAPFVGLDAPYPGRMSGNTIACFLLVCGAQVLMSLPGKNAGAATTAAVVLTSLASGIAFLAMLGFLVGLKGAYGWTDAVGMSMRTCAGILLIFFARIAALWQQDIVDTPGLPSWFLPFLAISVVTIAVGLIWIFTSPISRPFMLDPLYAAFGQRVAVATALSVGVLIFLGSVSVTVARHKAMTALVSEQRFRTLADSIPQLAWMAHADGFLSWYNQRWHDYTGKTPEQMEGWGWQSVHDPDVLPRVLTGWRDAIARAQPFEMEFPLRGADGTLRNFLTRGQPMKDSEGRLIQWFGTCTDVDQLKRTEQSLRVTQARLESTLEVSSVGTWMWDLASDRLIGDEFTARMFSIEASAAAEGLPAAAYLKVVHEEDRASVAEGLESAIQLCGPYDIEYRVRQDGGAFRWLQARGRVESDGAGHASYFHGAVIDVTERKQAERKIRESEERSTTISHDLRVAEAADRVKSAFLATMSHELRTPLNSIIGFTAIILKGLAGPLTAEQSKQLGMVRGSARHLLDLINDVLDLSKIEAGQLEVHAELFDLRVALEHVTASIMPQADKKGLTLVTVLSTQLGEIMSDRRRVEQIMINLLSNAVKFTERGSVTLTVTMVGDEGVTAEAALRPAVRIQVADTGIGIKPADLAMLFRPFRQIDGGLARGNEGTGLGLAISKRLATLLDGEISAASEWQQGSVFTLTLPLTLTEASRS